MTFNTYETINNLVYIHVLPNGWRAIYDGTFSGFKVYVDDGMWSLNGFGLDDSIQKELRIWFRYVMGLE